MADDDAQGSQDDGGGSDKDGGDDKGARGARSSSGRSTRERIREVVEDVLGDMLGSGELGVDDAGGDKGGADNKGDQTRKPRTAQGQEDDMESFVRGIVGKLDDEKGHKAEHERLARASREEAPHTERRITRWIWGGSANG